MSMCFVHKTRRAKWRFWCGLLLAFAGPPDAFAYRPFEGTDAAVADKGELEVELQPAGAQWQGSQKILVAPGSGVEFWLQQKLGTCSAGPA